MTLPQSLTLSPKVRLIPTPDIWPSSDLRSMTNLAFDFFLLPFFLFSVFMFFPFFRFPVKIPVCTKLRRPPPPRSVALPACRCASCLRCPPPDSSYCRPSPLVLSPVVTIRSAAPWVLIPDEMTDLSPLMWLTPLLHCGTLGLGHLNEGLSPERLKVGDTGLAPPEDLIGCEPVAVSSCCHSELHIACEVHPVGEVAVQGTSADLLDPSTGP